MNLLCVFLLLYWRISGASGRLAPISPSANSLYYAGDTIRVSWVDDTHRPSLEDTGPIQIDLYAGDSTFVETAATDVSPTAHSITFTVPLDLPFKLADYTLRFSTTIPAMIISSPDFILVSSSGPSIVMQTDNDPPTSPRTVTVTRTTVISQQQQQQLPAGPAVVTLTRPVAVPTQAALVSTFPQAQNQPLLAVGSTFIEFIDGSLRLVTNTIIQQQQDLPPATTTAAARAYPIFLSLGASYLPPSSSMEAISTNGSVSATSDSSAPLVPTSVAKPTSLKSSHAHPGAGRPTACSLFLTLFSGWFLISVILCATF